MGKDSGKDSGIDFMTIMIVVKLLSLGLLLYLWLWRGMTFWRSFGIYCLTVVAVAVIVEHPHAVTGVIIIVVPAAAEADLGKAAAIVGAIIAVVAIAIVIGIAVIIIIGVAIARRTVAARRIARTIDIAIIATAKRRRRENAERDGEGALQTLRHSFVLLGPTVATRHLGRWIARVELNLR